MKSGEGTTGVKNTFIFKESQLVAVYARDSTELMWAVQLSFCEFYEKTEVEWSSFRGKSCIPQSCYCSDTSSRVSHRRILTKKGQLSIISYFGLSRTPASKSACG